MNAHAGIRNGHCQQPGCNCATYRQRDGQGFQPCECGCIRKWHSQVWRDGEPQRRFTPVPTTATWFDIGAA